MPESGDGVGSNWGPRKRGVPGVNEPSVNLVVPDSATVPEPELSYEKLIKQANSFEELLSLFREEKIKGIQGTQKYFTAREIIKLLENLQRDPSLKACQYLTNSFGLRKKAMELLGIKK